MEQCLVFFDVDGTLLFHNNYFSKANADSIRRLKADGHQVFINSGRCRALMSHTLTDEIDFDGFVCGSTYVEYHGQVLHEKPIDDDTTRAVCRYCAANGIKVLLEGEKKVYSVNGGVFHPSVDITDDMERQLADCSKMKVTKFTFDRDLPQTVSTLFPTVRIINFGGYSEGICDGFTKAYGMKLLAEKLGVPRARVVAFGDSVNDIEMLKYAGISVIMRSSPDFLDSYATLRAASDEDGVSDGIKRLFYKE